MSKTKIPLEVSARHLHLCQKDLDFLFGKNYPLKPIKGLSQPGEFASDSVISLVGPKGTIERVRVIGPVRAATQVEISLTDARLLGINPPINVSGDLTGAADIKVVNGKKVLDLKAGVIAAKRHLHLSLEEAKKLKLTNGQEVSFKTVGDRGLVFDHVAVRAGEKYKMAFHVDTDEANAAGLKGEGEMAELVKKSTQSAKRKT